MTNTNGCDNINNKLSVQKLTLVYTCTRRLRRLGGGKVAQTGYYRYVDVMMSKHGVIVMPTTEMDNIMKPALQIDIIWKPLLQMDTVRKPIDIIVKPICPKWAL